MATVFIFHGIAGDPQENWFPWLKSRLVQDGYDVVVPQFPHAFKPDLAEWLDHFDPFVGRVQEDTIFVGHSLGAAFAMRVLERLDVPVHASFFVAPVCGVMGNIYDPLMTTFVNQAFDWKTITKNSRLRFVYHSDNDPYIKLSQVKDFSKKIDAVLTVVPSAGHFNAQAGYTFFHELLDKIREVMDE